MAETTFQFVLYPHHRADVHALRGEAQLIQKVKVVVDGMGVPELNSDIVLDPIGGPGSLSIEPSKAFRTVTVSPFTEAGASSIQKRQDWESPTGYGFNLNVDDIRGDEDWNDCFVDINLAYEWRSTS